MWLFWLWLSNLQSEFRCTFTLTELSWIQKPRACIMYSSPKVPNIPYGMVLKTDSKLYTWLIICRSQLCRHKGTGQCNGWPLWSSNGKEQAIFWPFFPSWIPHQSAYLILLYKWEMAQNIPTALWMLAFVYLTMRQLITWKQSLTHSAFADLYVRPQITSDTIHCRC